MSIRFRNTSGRSLDRLALWWTVTPGDGFEVKLNGKTVRPIGDDGKSTVAAPLVFEAPEPIAAGREASFEIRFKNTFALSPKTGSVTLLEWFPKLWWGYATNDDYELKLAIPAGFTVAASGRRDSKSGVYSGTNVRRFGLFIGRGMSAIESTTGGVEVRVIYTAESEPCAHLLHKTAVDVIEFFRQRYGFYPHSNLAILPGGPTPAGGYPVATAMVAIHGQATYKPETTSTHWPWITAHEIGHEYWSEHVLSGEEDSLGWLMLGMGIYADREYSRARGITDRHQGFFKYYAQGVARGYDTTLVQSPQQRRMVKWDWNNIVDHGKGFSVISALAATLGRETFERVYKRCLKEYAGRRLTAADFQRICEQESAQDLEWFFRQWVRSNRYLSYALKDKADHGVRVEKTGTLEMPVPVEAEFEDGSKQVLSTDRALASQFLVFQGKTRVKEYRLDPAGELPLVEPPQATLESFGGKLSDLAWTGAGKQALDLYQEALKLGLKVSDAWFKLGLTLYDGKYYAEALDAFQRAATTPALVWQGHILDLLGRRAEAIEKYREALRLSPDLKMQHDQYGMVVDRKWVEERLERPFMRK